MVIYYVETPPEVGYGLSLDPLGAGLLLLPRAIAIAVSGMLSGLVVEKGMATSVFAVGAILASISFAWLAFSHDHQWQFLAGTIAGGLGIGAAMSSGFGLAQLAVSDDDAGMATGMVAPTTLPGPASPPERPRRRRGASPAPWSARSA